MFMIKNIKRLLVIGDDCHWVKKKKKRFFHKTTIEGTGKTCLYCIIKNNRRCLMVKNRKAVQHLFRSNTSYGKSRNVRLWFKIKLKLWQNGLVKRVVESVVCLSSKLDCLNHCAYHFVSRQFFYFNHLMKKQHCYSSTDTQTTILIQ